jgi:hypothetical protein
MIDTVTEALQAKALKAINDTPGILTGSIRDPYTILVYTEERDNLETVALNELPLRFPLQGRLARWNFDNLGRVIAEKALCFRKKTGTVCLGVPRGNFPFRVFTVCEQTLAPSRR